jgi:hypothetical protein
MKTNNADSPKIQLKPRALPVSYARITKPPTSADRRGRGAEVRRRHLRVTGTLGVLRSGAEQGFVKVRDLLERLKATSFYLGETLLNSVEPWLKS